MTVNVPYGDDVSQFGELWYPEGIGPFPLVILIHGGFWRDGYGLDLMDPLASDLVARGFAVWNVEYRRVGQSGGGYPGTLDDVALAIDRLPTLVADGTFDLGRVSVVGHSAGGHLALWSAGRDDAVVVPTVVIGLGAVVDLKSAANDSLGGGAVTDLLGGLPDEVPDRYADATPPGAIDGVRLVSVRATGDTIVPAIYTVPAGANEYETVDVDGDHFTLIDPVSAGWQEAVDRLA